MKFQKLLITSSYVINNVKIKEFLSISDPDMVLVYISGVECLLYGLERAFHVHYINHAYKIGRKVRNKPYILVIIVSHIEELKPEKILIIKVFLYKLK